MRLTLLTAVVITITGCVSNEQIITDTRPECVTVTERFNSNRKLPSSSEFSKNLQDRYKGFYRVVRDEIWMYAENSRMEFVYRVYGMSGEMIGMKDNNGVDLTLTDLERLGPVTDLHDGTAERLPKFKQERERFLSEQKDSRIIGSKPFMADGKKTSCVR